MGQDEVQSKSQVPKPVLSAQRNALAAKVSKIRWRSLRTKIITWSFVPTAIILVAVALLTYYAYQQVTEELVIERDQDLTRLSARQLAAELAEYSDTLAAEARALGSYGGYPVAQRTTLERAGNRLVVFDGGVLILNTFGTVIATEPERPEILGQDWSNRTYFRQMVRSPKVIFSDIVTDGPQDAAVIVVAVPITTNQGEFLGTLVGMFRLGATTVSAFYGSIVKLRIGESGNAYLVDSNGRVIYHSDTDFIGQDFSNQAVVRQVLNRDVGAIRTNDFDGRDIVAGFAPVPGMPWGLVTEESWANLTSGSRDYGRFLLLLLLLGVLVPAMVVAIGVRRITNPITELIGAAQAVAGGDFGQTITPSTGDEIEDLAEQFNSMSAQLQISYTHMERMVVERTQELATLSALAAVVSRSLDLDEVLSDALDKSLQVMKVEAGAIYLLDSETEVLTVATQRGFSAQFVAEIDRLKVGEGISGRVAQSGQPLVVKDISTDPRLTRMVVREEGLHSLACVPIRSKGEVQGVLFAVTRGFREFTDQDVELLTAIGHQVGVAIENARLFETEQRRAEQFRVISEVGRRVTSILAVDELMGQMSRLIKESFKFYQVVIGLVEGDELVVSTGGGTLWDDPGFQTYRLKVGQEGITGWVAARGKPLLVPDVSQDPRFKFLPQAAKTRSELAVPITAKGNVIGVLDAMSDRLDAFDESDLAVLQALANQAAIAIENARLYEQAQQVAVLEERQRLARDLHDSATQSLYAVTMFAEAAARLLKSGEIEPATAHIYDVRDTSQEALQEMRLLIFELRPPILEKEGLVTALRTRLEMVEGRSGLETEFKIEKVVGLTPAVEEGLYRIAQEALNNILKHAHAQNVTVHLCQDQQRVILEITDDGVGFDPATNGVKGGLGLEGMQERVALLGGQLKISSKPGQGTTVRVEISR